MKLISTLILFKGISATVISDISNHNHYDWSHLPITGISSDGVTLKSRLSTLKDRLETQSDRHIAYEYLLKTAEDLLDTGVEPINIDEFIITAEAKITEIEATAEYQAASGGDTTSNGATLNTGSGSEVTGGGFTNNLDVLAPSNRGLSCVGCTVPLDLRDLFHYGCWCNLAGDLLQGQSGTLDPFDVACRDLQECLRCTIIDNGGDKTNCDPRVNPYQVPFFFFMPTLRENCDLVNSARCDSSFCMCQVHWVNTVLDLSFQGHTVDNSLDHSDPSFDYESACEVGEGHHGTREVACCGDYPGRFPFNDAHLDCCDNDATVFNPNTLVCCSNGVQTIGSC